MCIQYYTYTPVPIGGGRETEMNDGTYIPSTRLPHHMSCSTLYYAIVDSGTFTIVGKGVSLMSVSLWGDVIVIIMI